MKFECDSCGANYMIADEKVGKRGVKVKCKRCSHVIIVRPQAAEAQDDLPDPSVELSASEATPPAGDQTAAEPPAAEAGGEQAAGESDQDDGGVFGDPPSSSGEDDDDDAATTVGQPPPFSASGDDVDLGSIAGSQDDGGDGWASNAADDGADETTGLAAATSGEGDGPVGDGAHREEDTLAAQDDDGPSPAVTDEDNVPAPSDDDEAWSVGGSGDDVPAPSDDDDAWSAGASEDDVPPPPATDDEAPADNGSDAWSTSSDEDGDGGDAWSTSSDDAGDEDVPPPPGLDDNGFSPHEEKTSVGGVPGWEMSGENDTQMGAMPDVTDPNMQMPSMPDGDGLDDDDGEPPAPPVGLAGEDDALNALAGLGGGAVDEGDGGDLPVPPELDTGELPPAGDVSMPAAVKSEESDAFDAQLAGAFSNMFGDVPAGDPNAPQEGAFGDDLEGFRGPTQVLDAPQMDALREQATPSDEGYRDSTHETYTSDLDAAYRSMGGTMDTAMGDPIGGDVPTQMAGLEEDEGGWHVAIDDEDVGPLSLQEISDHIQAGRVDRDSLVWRTGMDDWEPAGDVAPMARLFDALPMPKIDAGFDVGAPIDDMGGPPPGADPFSNVPDVSADPNWQPHGLTDVYQAANLAEAAGLGLQGVGKSNGASGASADDDDEGEWRPGAAGALAALVEDEINRIDSDPVDEVSSPGLAPADDAGPGLFAEGAGAGAEVGGLGSAPSSAGFPAGGGLGAVGGLSTPGLSTPAMPMAGMSTPAMSTPAMPQVPTVDTYPPQAAMSGFAPVQPPAQQRSIVPWIVGGVVVVVLLLVVGVAATAAIVMSMNNSQPQVAATDDNAASSAGGGSADSTGAPAGNDDGTKVAMASATANKDDSAAPAGTKADQPAEAEAEAEDEAKGGDGDKDGDTAAAAKDDKAEKKAEEKEDTKKAEAKKADKPTKVASAKSSRKSKRGSSRKAEKRTSERRKDPPPPRKEKRKKTAKRGDCDPILDIDCEEKKSKKRKSGGNVKEKLSKSDILVVVKNNIGSIKSCFRKNGVTKTVKMEWKISKSGRTKGVRVLTSEFAGTPMGRCMTNAVKRFKFPKYSGSPPPPIKFPFKP
jgi:predicted Zn finger-like uncharacterized protein